MPFSRTTFFTLLLLVILILMQWKLWFQQGGILDLLKARKQLTLEVQANEKLRQRNQKLLDQVQHLQNNNEAIESRARHELGMIKKGEKFYQVIK